MIADRVVRAALKLVLEPIFESDFKPVSYGFRPKRRAQNPIAEIYFYGTHGYRWVLDADIAACFDEIDHAALMDQVRMRIKDKQVLALVKAFLKAGLLTVLDEHLHRAWEAGGEMSTDYRRGRRRAARLLSWQLVRYADDFVLLVDGTRQDTEALHEEFARVLARTSGTSTPKRTFSRLGRTSADPLGPCDHLTAETVESPLPSNGHGRFGERSGETDRE